VELDTVKQITEALIFASDSPVSISRIKSVISDTNENDIEQAIAELNNSYKEEGRVFEIRRVAGGFQIVTMPVYSKWIRKLKKGQTRQRLSHAGLEALSIIAVKQPVSRTEVAAIRGVHSDGVLKNLLERNLVEMAGRANTVGRPLLYRTTERFLTYFGIDDLSDLPTIEEIEQLLSAHQPEGREEEIVDEDDEQVAVSEESEVVDEPAQPDARKTE
jgi:segregation and condensation protein B